MQSPVPASNSSQTAASGHSAPQASTRSSLPELTLAPQATLPTLNTAAASNIPTNNTLSPTLQTVGSAATTRLQANQITTVLPSQPMTVMLPKVSLDVSKSSSTAKKKLTAPTTNKR